MFKDYKKKLYRKLRKRKMQKVGKREADPKIIYRLIVLNIPMNFFTQTIAFKKHKMSFNI